MLKTKITENSIKKQPDGQPKKAVAGQRQLL